MFPPGVGVSASQHSRRSCIRHAHDFTFTEIRSDFSKTTPPNKQTNIKKVQFLHIYNL